MDKILIIISGESFKNGGSNTRNRVKLSNNQYNYSKYNMFE